MKKIRIVATLLLVVLLSAGLNNTANAHPWGYRYGWCRPHVGVRVVVPPVVVGSYYGPAYGAYYGPRVYPRAYAYRPYCAPHYYGYRHGCRRW